MKRVCPEELCERILARYACYYDIDRAPELFGENPAAKAEFHSRGEKYFLVRRAKIWAMECNEIVFLFRERELTPERVEQLSAFMRKCEPVFVKPHNEHMYTYLTLLIAAERVLPEAERAVRRLHFTKNYKCGLYGYSTLQAAVFDCEKRSVRYNRAGRALRGTFRKVYPQDEQSC